MYLMVFENNKKMERSVLLCMAKLVKSKINHNVISFAVWVITLNYATMLRGMH